LGYGGGQHPLEGAAVYCEGRPGALVSKGHRIVFGKPETLKRVSTKDVVLSQDAYEAIPYRATLPAGATVIALDDKHPAVFLAKGVGGKEVALMIGNNELVRVNESPMPFTFVPAPEYYRLVKHKVADLAMVRQGQRLMHLHHALRELKEARHELRETKHNFGSHRESALRAVNEAIQELERALRHYEERNK